MTTCGRAVGVVGVVLLWSALALPVGRWDDPRFTDPVGVLDGSGGAGTLYVVACAVSTVAFGLLWWRGARLVLVALLLAAAVVAVMTILDVAGSGELIWDGETADGRATGGYARTGPASGAWLGAGGGVLVGASALVLWALDRIAVRRAPGSD